jgi:hypothetical protein
MMFAAAWFAVVTSAFAEPPSPMPLRRVAGPPAAEDLLVLPGTPWVLVSAISVGAEAVPGIYAVGTNQPHLEKLSIDLAGATEGSKLGCPAPLDVPGFSPLGIAWRTSSTGPLDLLVLNRGSRKAVEIFDVTSGPGVPKLRWRDCLPLPVEVVANSVAAIPEGTVLVTQNSDSRIKDAFARQQRGEKTGQLYAWRPDGGWSTVPGTSLSGPNGVVASADGCYAIVAAWAERRLARVPLPCNGSTKVTTASIDVPYMPDNLRWTDRGTVLATGQITTPDGLLACVRQGGPCPDQVVVSEIDPGSMKTVNEWRLAAGDTLGLGTTALQVGDEIWVSSILGHVIGRFTPPKPH